MKKIKNLDYLLSLGLVILQFAGYSLVDNSFITNNILKCSIIFIIAVMSYLLAILFKKLLGVDMSSRVAYSLGSLGIVNTFILAGVFKLFGSWYSFVGDGVAIFLASIFILIGILAILTIVIYKNYKFIHLAYIAVIGMFISLFIHFKLDYLVLMLILSLVLFLLNLFKSKKNIFEFSSVAIRICAVFSAVAYFSNNIVLASILFVINIISLIRVLLVKKNFEYELFNILVMSGVMLFFVSRMTDAFDDKLCLILSVGIISIIDLVITTLRCLDSKFAKVFYKITSSLVLLIVFFCFDFNPIANLIAVAFVLITSIVNTFAIHNDDYEKYFLPFKVLFLSSYLISLLGGDSFVPLAFSIQALVFSILYRVINRKNTRIPYAIILGLSIFVASLYADKSLISNVVAIISFLATYLIFRGKEEDKVSNALLFVLLFSLFGMVSSSILEVLFIVIVVGILSFIHKDNKLCFAISMCVLAYSIEEFLSLCIKNYDIYIIVSYLMSFLVIGIVSEVLFDNNKKAKNIFAGIIYTFCLLGLLGEASSFITYIFALISALVLVLVSIKTKEYKSLYYIGFIFSVIYLIQMLGLFDNIPSSIYLIVIAITLIIIVSIMIYRYQNNKDLLIEEEKEEKKVIIPKYNLNYCSECGSKIDSKDIYCSECGKKVR